MNKLRPLKKFVMRQPLHAERRYKKLNKILFNRLRDLVKEKILLNYVNIKKSRKEELKADSAFDQVLLFISSIRESHLNFLQISGLHSLLTEIFTEVSEVNKNEILKLFSESAGTVSPFFSEPWLIPEVDAFTSYNVSKITTIHDGLLSQVEEIVTRSVRSGATYKSLAQELNQAFYSSRRKSELVARDQIQKFNASVNRIRQEKNGVKTFIWRQLERGERSRKSHRKLDGNTYTWKKGADGIYPTEEPNCSCYAEPVL